MKIEKLTELLHEFDYATRKLLAGLQLVKVAVEDIKNVSEKFLEEIEKEEKEKVN